MREPEKEKYLTGEMFSDVCREFAILYGRENCEGSADDLRAHLYDHFKRDLRRRRTDAACSKNLQTNHHQQDCSYISAI